MKKSKTITISHLSELTAFAKRIATELSRGDVLLLSGELGAGKTTFVQALVKALGGNSHVTSPTFVLRNDYTIGDKRLLHIDLYRLEKGSANSFEFLESVGSQDTITCIEWPERLHDMLSVRGDVWRLSFSIVKDDIRSVTIEHTKKIA